MELKLNIYKHGKVVKTYKTNDFTLTTGTCEDVLKLIDFEQFMKNTDPNELGIAVLHLISSGIEKFRPFFLDVFDGMTEDEFRNTSIKELVQVVMQIVTYSMEELSAVGSNDPKN